MSDNVLPYSHIVGQEELKCALELSFIEPRISGVLVSGERGSGKSTTVRAFSKMVYGKLPVTLPINATEDRVVGGWDVGDLLQSKPTLRTGLLEEADGRMLYVDEVNLLDDHIVNIILDVTASGLLNVERDGQARDVRVAFTLVGTMNPEEGTLRPQLLDRFGLMVDVRGITDAGLRFKVLDTVLKAQDKKSLAAGAKEDTRKREHLERARERLTAIDIDERIQKICVQLSQRFEADGHRGEYMLALAARALAANQGVKTVTSAHVGEVAPLALQHRRKVGGQRELSPWTPDDTKVVEEILAGPGR